MDPIRLPVLECSACGHRWLSRKLNPAEVCACPACKSRTWNQLRKEKKKCPEQESANVAPIVGL